MTTEPTKLDMTLEDLRDFLIASGKFSSAELGAALHAAYHEYSVARHETLASIWTPSPFRFYKVAVNTEHPDWNWTGVLHPEGACGCTRWPQDHFEDPSEDQVAQALAAGNMLCWFCVQALTRVAAA